MIMMDRIACSSLCIRQNQEEWVERFGSTIGSKDEELSIRKTLIFDIKCDLNVLNWKKVVGN